jgi:hypothetical protein
MGFFKRLSKSSAEKDAKPEERLSDGPGRIPAAFRARIPGMIVGC